MPGAAQFRDQSEDANSARYDMMFGAPGSSATVAPSNLFATTPGLEQQARRSQFTINGLVPMFFNSNAEALTTGGTNSAEFSPILGASWSTPVFDLPVRFTANARAEVDRFTQAPTVDFDKILVSGRLQYVDTDNDQAYSPYIAYAPRWDFAPFYQTWLTTRQDLNFGVNKTFNFNKTINMNKNIVINKPVTINKNINIEKNIDLSKNINIEKNIDLSKKIEINKTITINKGNGNAEAIAAAFAFASANAFASAINATVPEPSSSAPFQIRSSSLPGFTKPKGGGTSRRRPPPSAALSPWA